MLMNAQMHAETALVADGKANSACNAMQSRAHVAAQSPSKIIHCTCMVRNLGAVEPQA